MVRRIMTVQIEHTLQFIVNIQYVLKELFYLPGLLSRMLVQDNHFLEQMGLRR